MNRKRIAGKLKSYFTRKQPAWEFKKCDVSESVVDADYIKIKSG
jgi:hypothetical protein